MQDVLHPLFPLQRLCWDSLRNLQVMRPAHRFSQALATTMAMKSLPITICISIHIIMGMGGERSTCFRKLV